MKKHPLQLLQTTTLTTGGIIMWIINKYGVAVNTDNVARFRQDGDTVKADIAGLPQMVHIQIIGKTTVEEIIRNIISGTKIMEVM
jgi:hypothetical protein